MFLIIEGSGETICNKKDIFWVFFFGSKYIWVKEFAFVGILYANTKGSFW